MRFIYLFIALIPVAYTNSMDMDSIRTSVAQYDASILTQICLENEDALLIMQKIDQYIQPFCTEENFNKRLLLHAPFTRILETLLKRIAFLSENATLHNAYSAFFIIQKKLLSSFSTFMRDLIINRFMAYYNLTISHQDKYLLKLPDGSNSLSIKFLNNDQTLRIILDGVKIDSCLLFSYDKSTNTWNKQIEDTYDRRTHTWNKPVEERLIREEEYKIVAWKTNLEYASRSSVFASKRPTNPLEQYIQNRFQDGAGIAKRSHNKSLIALCVHDHSRAILSDRAKIEQTTKIKIIIYLWDVTTNEIRSCFEKEWKAFVFEYLTLAFAWAIKKPIAYKIGFSKNDGLLFLLSNYGLLLLGIATNRIIVNTLSPRHNLNLDGTFSRDDLQLLVLDRDKHNLYLYETKDGTCIRQFSVLGSFGKIKLSQDEMSYALTESAKYPDKIYIIRRSDTFMSLLYRLYIAYCLDCAHSKLTFEDVEERIFGNKQRLRPRLRAIAARNLLSKGKNNHSLTHKKALLEEASSSAHDLEINQFSSLNNFEKENAAQWYLAVNGEGLDTLVCAGMLKKIEEITGQRIHKLFDCIVGSSCAALLGFGIACSHDSINPLVAPHNFIKMMDLAANSFDDGHHTLSFEHFLPSFTKGALLSNSLTRIIVPWVEQTIKLEKHNINFNTTRRRQMFDTSPVLLRPVRTLNVALTEGVFTSSSQAAFDRTTGVSIPKPVIYDSYEAQRDLRKDCYVEEAAFSASGDGSHLPFYVVSEGNSHFKRSASSVYKNDSARYLHDTIFAKQNQSNRHLLSLSTGIVTENNRRTDELFKNELALDSEHYIEIGPGCDGSLIVKKGTTTEELVALGEDSIVRASETIRRLMRSKQNQTQ